ncbi:hypothetical protein ACLOJK_007187 [Asimina triloba]
MDFDTTLFPFQDLIMRSRWKTTSSKLEAVSIAEFSTKSEQPIIRVSIVSSIRLVKPNPNGRHLFPLRSVTIRYWEKLWKSDSAASSNDILQLNMEASPLSDPGQH